MDMDNLGNQQSHENVTNVDTLHLQNQAVAATGSQLTHENVTKEDTLPLQTKAVAATGSQQTHENVTKVDTQPLQDQADYIFMNRKVIKDPIHGHIELHPVCVRIIDTPQFQRLRHIKQLETCYLVYPGASHNRFEHSLGTCHLAGTLMRKLKERQPVENITEMDILCVEIAGLCHDLGQGPFSHVFEKRFMPTMERKDFTHEEMARKMFKYMIEDNNDELKKDLQKIIGECQIPGFAKFEDKDFLFIEEMIDCPKDIESGEWPYSGRDESKSFMYEIVANKRNGIDVDKWDYLARDSYMLGMKVNFDYRKCLMNARVLKAHGFNETNDTNGSSENVGNNERRGNGGTNGNNGDHINSNGAVARKQICYREKDAQDFYDMFYTRMTLHRNAYQHKTHKIIGMMICDALQAANETVKFIGKERKPVKISDTVDDMKAYTQLTDTVFEIILYLPATAEEKKNNEEKNGFQRSKDILNNITKRNLYKCVVETQVEEGKFDEIKFKEEVISPLNPSPEEFFYYDVVHLDYGKKGEDPMTKVRFYSKDEFNKPILVQRKQVSYVLPGTFAEIVVRIYCKNTYKDDAYDQRILDLKISFGNWCKKYGIPLPKGFVSQ